MTRKQSLRCARWKRFVSLGEGDAGAARRELEEELQLAGKADQIICVSETERRHFIERGIGPVYVLGHRLEPRPTSSYFDERRDILFVGETHGVDSPNADSVLWFCHASCRLFAPDLAVENVRLAVVGQNSLYPFISS